MRTTSLLFLAITLTTAISTSHAQTTRLTAQPTTQPARAEYILNVDYLDQAWWGQTGEPFYHRNSIAQLLQNAKKQGFTRVLWRISAFGESMFPSKVRKPYDGDSRPESKRAADTLKDFDPFKVGIEECRKLNLKVYAWITIYDEGGSLPGVSGVKSQIIIDHPEYQWCSRDGKEHFVGTLCYAYPDVRQHRLDEIAELLTYDVDGVFLSTRSHCRPTDADERFGFNQPIVDAYKKRYGVDIRTEEFDKQQWRDLRGEFLSLFIKQAHDLCASHKKELVVGLRAGDEIGWPLGKMTIHWREWVKQGWIDGLCTYALNDVLFTPPQQVRDWVEEIKSVTQDRTELWVWVRLWDWSSRFPKRSSVPADAIRKQMQHLHAIPGINSFAFHEALILEDHNLWPGLER